MRKWKGEMRNYILVENNPRSITIIKKEILFIYTNINFIDED